MTAARRTRTATALMTWNRKTTPMKRSPVERMTGRKMKIPTIPKKETIIDRNMADLYWVCHVGFSRAF